MPDFEVVPADLETAAQTVSGEAGTVAGLAGQVTAPSSSACGSLLENAFSFTFPRATDSAKAYIEAMADGAEAISETLTLTAGYYRTVEDDAIGLVETIWSGH